MQQYDLVPIAHGNPNLRATFYASSLADVIDQLVSDAQCGMLVLGEEYRKVCTIALVPPYDLTYATPLFLSTPQPVRLPRALIEPMILTAQSVTLYITLDDSCPNEFPLNLYLQRHHTTSDNDTLSRSGKVDRSCMSPPSRPYVSYPYGPDPFPTCTGEAVHDAQNYIANVRKNELHKASTQEDA